VNLTIIIAGSPTLNLFTAVTRTVYVCDFFTCNEYPVFLNSRISCTTPFRFHCLIFNNVMAACWASVVICWFPRHSDNSSVFLVVKLFSFEQILWVVWLFLKKKVIKSRYPGQNEIKLNKYEIKLNKYDSYLRNPRSLWVNKKRLFRGKCELRCIKVALLKLFDVPGSFATFHVPGFVNGPSWSTIVRVSDWKNDVFSQSFTSLISWFCISYEFYTDFFSCVKHS